MHDGYTAKSVTFFSRLAYTIGCMCLYGIGIWIFAASVHQMFVDFTSEGFTIFDLLDEVGLIIFSIAVIDVAKHLMIEEVIRSNERSPKEERRVFSRFLVIIATALSLEGLVITIEIAKTNLDKIILPIGLFLVITLFIIGIGIYQKLAADADRGES